MKKVVLVSLILALIVLIVLVIFLGTTKDRFVLLDTYRVPIYCINLPSEVTRRKHIQETFGGYVEFVEAVDTRGEKWKEYTHYLTEEGIAQMKRSERTKKRKKHYELTPGAIGCFLSHLKCWDKFLDTYPSDSDVVFILEDDTMPTKTFDKKFSKIIQDFPPDCDILLCDHLAFGEMDPIEHNGVEYKKLVPYSAFYLLNAYFITARGIKKIMNDLFQRDNKFYKQLDSHLSDIMNEDVISVFILSQNECFQIGISPTSIQTFTI